MGKTKNYITLYNSYYHLNTEEFSLITQTNQKLIHSINFNIILEDNIKNKDNNIKNEDNNNIEDENIKSYIYELTQDIPTNKVLHKIKQITYHILNISKLLINNIITKALITYNIEPVSKLISTISISGINFIINELLLSKIYEDLTEEEKDILLSISKDIKYIYKKFSKLLNEQIIKLMNNKNCCC